MAAPVLAAFSAPIAGRSCLRALRICRPLQRQSRPFSLSSSTSFKLSSILPLLPPFIRRRFFNDMEVTLNDFPDILPTIISDIRNAQFIAIDTEFSGILRTRAIGVTGRHSIENRYEHAKIAASKFQVLQFGICTVAFDNELDAYVCRPYCFNVNPSVSDRWGLDREFHVQASAAQFLVRNGLDLTNLFVEGIPYLREDEEKALLERADRYAEGQEVRQDVVVEEGEIKFVEKFVNDVQAWADNPEPEYDFINITGEGNNLNSYQRLLVHQTIRAKFPGLTTASKGTFVQITRTNLEAEKQARTEKSDRTRKEIEEGVGLRRVMDALRESRKPIVGHNIFIDLIHLYHTFVAPLPPTLSEFTSLVHRDFPFIIDTKLIATCGHRCSSQTTTLQNLSLAFSTLSEPNIQVHSQRQPSTAASAHDAGFDALMTVKVMMQMMTYLAVQVEKCGGDKRKAMEKLAAFINSSGIEDPVIVRGSKVPALEDEKSKTLWDGLVNQIRLNRTEEGVIRFGP